MIKLLLCIKIVRSGIVIRKVKISFCIVSFLFLLACGVIFGYRFIKLYFDNKKMLSIERNSLVKTIRDNNHENQNYKDINGEEYFINNSNNNYLLYSNILWRIIKVNSDNSISAISDKSLTSLSFGQGVKYNESQIDEWLNNKSDDLSGILEKNLNSVDKYLVKTNSCLDNVDEFDNNSCTDLNNDYYFSLLSTRDLANTGKDSYLINSEFFYLNNTNSQNQVWYISDDGKLSLDSGLDIMGVRPVITIKPNIDYVSGNGYLDNPYMIEKENSLFGAYVKLDNDIWRVYQVNDNEIRISLNDYLKINDNFLSHRYSNDSSFYNDNVLGSIAYYLNHDYLNGLSYKDKIKDVTWSNGIYDKTNYKNVLKNTVVSKVALLSIGYVKLNNLDNYFIMSSTPSNANLIYVNLANQKLYTRSVQAEFKIVPTISIDKDLLKKGNGTIDSPFEME